MEERLIELETRMAFQDNTLQTLNSVILRQQKEIDALRHEIEVLKTQIRTLAPSLVASSAEETPPPHY
jgi:SlyX protein